MEPGPSSSTTRPAKSSGSAASNGRSKTASYTTQRNCWPTWREWSRNKNGNDSRRRRAARAPRRNNDEQRFLPITLHLRLPTLRVPMADAVERNDRRAAGRQRGQRDGGVGERERWRLPEDDRRRGELGGGDRAWRRGAGFQGRGGVRRRHGLSAQHRRGRTFENLQDHRRRQALAVAVHQP